jgi:CRISPR-associated protein Csx17
LRTTLALKGCTVEPMASYLKALAILRLVGEQADSSARGWWSGDTFYLDSRFDEEGIVRFFLEEYRPTPIVAPWNGGSGFSEGDRKDGIEAILGSGSPRFEEYRRTIREILSWPETRSAEMTLAEIVESVQRAANEVRPGKARDGLLALISEFENATKAAGRDREQLLSLTSSQIEAEAKPVYKAVSKLRTAAKKQRRVGGKDEIVRACRNRLGNRVVGWVDSAVVLRTATDLLYPPILGTGGTEGRLDYTNSFMERVSALLLGSRSGVESLLRNALFSVRSNQLSVAAVGQLDPGRAGGYNQGPEIETKDFPTNHWNFVLALEGAAAWASGAGRRQGVASYGVFCSPFTVRPRAVGYDSAKEQDEKASRAEIWMPIWIRRCCFEELRTLLREGRVEWSGKPVENAMDFAEAVTSLGTDRGIDSFQRYSMIKRRGDSFLALPLGRVPVRERQDSDLLEELDKLLFRVDSFTRRFRSDVPAQLQSLRRQVDSAIYDFVLRGGAKRMQNILASLGRMEQYFAGRDLRREPKLDYPLSGLSSRWLTAADDGSVDFRIAVALASVRSTGDVGSIRANLAPVDPKKPWSWIEGSGQTAWRGSNLPQRMLTILRRRLMDSERLRAESLPLAANVAASPEDVAAFIADEGIDESRIEDLMFGCTLIDTEKTGFGGVFSAGAASFGAVKTVIPRSYALLKHLFHPKKDWAIRPEPAILSLLSAGRTREACDVAQRRLRISGFRPVHATFPDVPDGIRLAASLLIPIHSMERLSGLVLHKQEQVAVEAAGRVANV